MTIDSSAVVKGLNIIKYFKFRDRRYYYLKFWPKLWKLITFKKLQILFNKNYSSYNYKTFPG